MGLVAIQVIRPGWFDCIFVPSTLPQVRLFMTFVYNWPSGFLGDVPNRHTMSLLGQRSNDDLDFSFSQIFVYSLRQL